MKTALFAFPFLLAACASSVSSTDGGDEEPPDVAREASVDVPTPPTDDGDGGTLAWDSSTDRGLDVADAVDAADPGDAIDASADEGSRRDATGEVEDATEAGTLDVSDGFGQDADASNRDVSPSTDVPPSPDASVCEQDPPSGPPPGTGRSCGIDRAAPWQCREVHHCAARFEMGSTEAWEINTNTPRMLGTSFMMRTCDVHRATVRSGYVDAFEVTVARFRAWVRAGMPHPAANAVFFNGHRWLAQYDGDIALPNAANATEDRTLPAPTSDMCTWSPVAGVRDDLPINCVPIWSAVAFCWWEGKHLATEAAWEYVARNEGTTALPFGRAAGTAADCDLGDVGRYTGLCEHSTLPRAVNAFPIGATRSGIHGLWGGVQELTLGANNPYAEVIDPFFACGTPAATTVDGELRSIMARGAAWYQSQQDHQRFLHGATRIVPPINRTTTLTPGSPRIGFRCMRWVGEPR